MATYQLRFQFKSNERPWAGSLDGQRIGNNEQAKDWARRFEAAIGDDYYVTLWKHGVPMSFEP